MASPKTKSRSGASGRRRAHKPLKPFTVDHFRTYARLLVLDNGDHWEPEKFQLDLVAELFGDIPETWFVVPEANGKTTLMGGVALYFADYTPTASILMGAASRDQCGLLFGQAAGFIYRSPGFNRKRFRVFEGYRRIDALRTDGRIQVYAADDRTGDGVIPGGIVLLDELHRQRDMRLYRTWRGKLGKRGAKLCAISTAGEPGTEFEETRERIKKQATELTTKGGFTRAATPEIVLHEYMVPVGADVEDMKVVKSANPFSGITVKSLEAKRKSPTVSKAHWRRMVCNQATRGESSAITETEWDNRVGDDIPFGETVWCGLDLGWKWDTTAIMPMWMPDFTRRAFGTPKILTPPRDGTSMAPERLHEALLEVHERNPIHTIVMDENAGGAQLVGWIETELGAGVVNHSQGHTAMALAYDRWMEAMREKWLTHTGDLEFRRHVLNAVERLLPSGMKRFDRPAGARNTRTTNTQDRRVWDALTAASMVHSIAVGNFDVEDDGGSEEPMIAWG